LPGKPSPRTLPAHDLHHIQEHFDMNETVLTGIKMRQSQAAIIMIIFHVQKKPVYPL
jgi:hypothetical protein